MIERCTISMKTKSVIISGANGYFGGIACKYFQENGWNVLKAVRNCDGDIYLDLDQPYNLSKIKVNQNIDLFIHAAAAHEISCREDPYKSISRNIIGTKAALDFCVNNNIRNFVYLSTFHVFGNPSGVIDESTFPFPLNDYGLSHLQAEEYVRMYERLGLVKGLVIRPSNFFGLPANIKDCKRWTLAPLAFCKSAVENKFIKLESAGYQVRNFVSVLDICKVINSAFDKNISLIHIPGPDTLSIRELAQLVKRKVEKEHNVCVELFIPDGDCFEDNFIYTSLFLKDIFSPNDRISNFIIDFCNILKKECDL
jgi:UDP-glucose 4-epimerase